MMTRSIFHILFNYQAQLLFLLDLHFLQLPVQG
jgi:hypothetical protein